MIELNKKIERIHNYIYANDGLDNYEVLSELLKVFYIKTYDEIHSNSLMKTANNDELLNTISYLLKTITESFPKLFEGKTDFMLKTESLIFVFKELADFKISELDSDFKGHLMQRILDRSFREGRGQFFTPAPVVDFIVKMINPKPGEKGCDPACGTGGFMFAAIENMKKTSVNVKEILKNIDFFDISKSVIKLIAMRLMFEFSEEEANVKIQDSISTEIPSLYDFILTNPPFGSQGRITDKKILSKFILGQAENGKQVSSQVPDILFVEKVISMLRDGGRCAIVLPDGNFENPTSKYFREFLISKCRIDAIVSLPDGTFVPYGTGVKSSIIFMTKTKTIENYEVFFGKINQLGYSFSKHSKPVLDKSGSVIEDYSSVLSKYKNKEYDENNFVVNINTIIENNTNFAYNYYCLHINNEISRLVGNSQIKIQDVATVETKKVKIDPDKLYKYIEISDLNATGCEIINSNEMVGSELPSRASYLLKENQIIVATSGNAIGTIWNTKAIVTKEYANCICTNGFMVVNAKGVSPFLLLHFFNSEAFRVQVQKYRYGTAIPTISREDFMSIILPEYSEKQKVLIINNMEKAFKLKEEIKQLLLSES